MEELENKWTCMRLVGWECMTIEFSKEGCFLLMVNNAANDIVTK